MRNPLSRSKARRMRDFHASIRHHPSGRSAIRQNAVAPIRGNGINVPADASGCNLNPAFDLDVERCASVVSCSLGPPWRMCLRRSRPWTTRLARGRRTAQTQAHPDVPLLVRLGLRFRNTLPPQGTSFEHRPHHACQVMRGGHDGNLPPTFVASLELVRDRPAPWTNDGPPARPLRSARPAPSTILRG